MRSLGVLGILVLAASCGTDGQGDLEVAPDAGAPRDAGPEDGGSTERDGGVDLRDGGPPITCAASSPRREQGYGGGAIDGRIVVFAIDDRGAPLAGATVLVRGATVDAMETTDAEGCAQIDVASGPVDVHVLMNGRRYVSWQAISARELTVELRDVIWTRSLAVFDGQVLGLDQVLSATTAELGRGAEVWTLDRTPFAGAPIPAMRSEEGAFLPENIVVEGAGLDLLDYRRVVYPEQVNGLYVLAGPYSSPPPGIDATHIGVVTAERLDPGETRTQDIEVTHALSETLLVELPGAGGLPVRAAVGVLFLPDEAGLVKLAPDGPGLNVTVSVPPLTGAFAGATYGAIVRAQDAAASPSVIVDLVHPGSASTRLNIGSFGALPSQLALDGRSVSADTPRSDLVQLYLVGGNGWSTWVVNRTAVDAGPFIVEFPGVPEGIDDPVDDLRRVTLSVSDYASFEASESFPLADYFNGVRLRRQVRRNLEVVF